MQTYIGLAFGAAAPPKPPQLSIFMPCMACFHEHCAIKKNCANRTTLIEKFSHFQKIAK